MPKYPKLADNLNYLIKKGAIPKTRQKHLGDDVKQAINDLSKDDMATLIKLTKTANAHLFVHDKDNHVIAMGL